LENIYGVWFIIKVVNRKISEREYGKRERDEKYSRFDELFDKREKEKKYRRKKCV